MIITIDGPVAAGKTTVAAELATRLAFSLLDTGAIYRCLAVHARDQGIEWSDEDRLAELARRLPVKFLATARGNRVFLGGRDSTRAIRDTEISEGASLVSALPAVRRALLGLQRDLGARGNLVVEGRDTGTVVFPDADAKFYLTADPEVRARRRFAELRETDSRKKFVTVLAALRKRDARDVNREVAPLVKAPDAIVVDSSEMSVDEVVEVMLRHLASSSDAGKGP